MIKFYSNGKLLLTGEYLVLNGALSLAVPTQLGQSFLVEHFDERKIIWESIDDKGNVWFEDEFEINNEISRPDSYRDTRNDSNISKRLLQILNIAKKLNPNFLKSEFGFKITTRLDFPQFWGLGSSSTLINNIAKWANVDAYKLLELTFGGSGYDIACANHNNSITYKLTRPLDSARRDKISEINSVDFNPNFKNNLYFVYLNKKQNSRDGIDRYYATKNNSDLAISEISEITTKIINCNSLKDFESLIYTHEQIISKIIKQKPIKELLFNDYKGAIKSLGAWGGDFILAIGNKDSINYFRGKGYNTIIPYSKMVLNKK